MGISGSSSNDDDTTRSNQTGGDLPDARCHHYNMAHYALPVVAFEDPLFFMSVIASKQSKKFLSNLLDMVSRACKETEPVCDFTVDDFAVYPTRIGSYPCAIIEMPPSRAVPEAFFAAVILLTAPDDNLHSDAGDIKLRYITLEKGATLNGSLCTVLCEWTSDRTHRNYGDGPEAKLDAFAAAVKDLLERQV